MSKKINSIADLQPDSANANRGTKRGLGLLDNSLRQYGAGRSILADKHGVVIAGNKTLERAADIGLPVRVVETDGTELVVVQRTDLDIDSKQGRELAYADNRVGQVDLDWNPDQLLADVNAGIDLANLFGADDLDAILRDAAGYNTPADDPGADDSRAAELQAKWKTELGQLWAIGRHRLLCGDCTVRENVERVMGGEKADALITDPPYGINIVGRNNTAGNFPGTHAPRLKAVPIVGDEKPFDPLHLLGGADVVVLWGANHYADKLPASSKWLIWDKKDGAFEGSDLGDCEMAWTSMTGAARLMHHTWQGMYRKGEGERAARLHPTQKPVAVMEWCIEQCGDVQMVADFYCGSGTTIVACERLGRQCRAIEISPAYVAVTLERLAGMGLTPELQ